MYALVTSTPYKICIDTGAKQIIPEEQFVEVALQDLLREAGLKFKVAVVKGGSVVRGQPNIRAANKPPTHPGCHVESQIAWALPDRYPNRY